MVRRYGNEQYLKARVKKTNREMGTTTNQMSIIRTVEVFFHMRFKDYKTLLE